MAKDNFEKMSLDEIALSNKISSYWDNKSSSSKMPEDGSSHIAEIKESIDSFMTTCDLLDKSFVNLLKKSKNEVC